MRGTLILLVDGERSRRSELKNRLLENAFDVVEAENLDRIPGEETERFDLVIIVCGACPDKQLAWAPQLRLSVPDTPVIVIAPHSSEELAVRALKAGARDYFRMPLAYGELLGAIHKVLSSPTKCAISTTEFVPNQTSVDAQPIIGQSKAIDALVGYSKRVACSDCNVLITGETGTGKELVAELIHRHSSRRLRPFVCINCAAIPDTLLESELFGYERGAFTGANWRNTGKVAGAEGGTVFLDEIGEMSAYAQAKVLRVIESKEIQRLGSRKSFPVNIRVVAATNKNLEALVAENSFRRDLYFRLNVASIHLLPLRERKEDIPHLLHYYIQVLNRKYGQHVRGSSEEAMNRLLQYDWPGNIRELKNVLESIYVSRTPTQIEARDLPENILRSAAQGVHGDQERLTRILEQCKWNKSKAAEQLNWSRMTVYRKMAQYGIKPSSVKPAESAAQESQTQPKAS